MYTYIYTYVYIYIHRYIKRNANFKCVTSKYMNNKTRKIY